MASFALLDIFLFFFFHISILFQTKTANGHRLISPIRKIDFQTIPAKQHQDQLPELYNKNTKKQNCRIFFHKMFLISRRISSGTGFLFGLTPGYRQALITRISRFVEFRICIFEPAVRPEAGNRDLEISPPRNRNIAQISCFHVFLPFLIFTETGCITATVLGAMPPSRLCEFLITRATLWALRPYRAILRTACRVQWYLSFLGNLKFTVY